MESRTRYQTNKQTNKQKILCLPVELFVSLNNECYIDLKKKPTLMENQFLPGKPGLSNRQKAVLKNTCFLFFNISYFLYVSHRSRNRQKQESLQRTCKTFFNVILLFRFSSGKNFYVRSCSRIVHADIRDIFLSVVIKI